MKNNIFRKGNISFKNYIFFISIIFVSFKAFSQPTINSFSPSSGPVGTIITITGANFNITPNNNIVFIGGVKAFVQASTTTSITAVVPAGGISQPISITVNGLTGYSNKPFIFSFSGGTPQFTSQSFEFEAKVDSVDSNIETTKYTIGDIDCDGKIDVITVDRLNNKLSVYRNTTSGGLISFARKIDFSTGQKPRALTVGDIDGDGKPDIIVSNLSDNTVSVYKNNSTAGNVSLAPKIDFITAAQPSVISIADLDKDGRPDLVINTINLGGSSISILQNTSTGGSISFSPKIDLIAGGSSIEEIRTADIDGDLKTDILLPNYSSGSITIFRNISSVGTISFAPIVNIMVLNYPQWLEINDLNNDDKPDLQVSYYLSGTTISIKENKGIVGNIVFNSPTSLITEKYTNGISANDFNGDGSLDLAVNNGLESFSLFKNISLPGGTISFGSRVTIPALYNSNVSSADFDGDGMPDLAFNTGIYRVTIWKNKTTSPQIFSFTPTTAAKGSTVTISGFNFSDVSSVSFGGVPAASYSVINSTTISAVVDSGASGNVEVISSGQIASQQGFVFIPAPKIYSFTPTGAGMGSTININGVNLSGAISVSFGGVPAASFIVNSSTNITAVIGSGSSGNLIITTAGGVASMPGFTFYPKPGIISFTPTEGTLGTSVTISGINFDTVSEVQFGGISVPTFTKESSSTIKVTLLNGASGSVKVLSPGGSDSLTGFTYNRPIPPIVTSIFPTKGQAGTSVKIFGSNFAIDTSKNYVYFGPVKARVIEASMQSLTVIVPQSATYGPVSVTTNYLTSYSPQTFIPTFSKCTLTENSFSEYTNIFTGLTPNDVCISDFDGDGKSDLATANYSDYSISVLRNNSVLNSFAFEQKVDYKGSNILRIASLEIDGDGKKDIVTISHYPNRLSVFKNQCTPGVISFSNPVNFSLSKTPLNFTTGDLDNDGKTDIVISNGASITIFKNISDAYNIVLKPDIEINTPFGFGGLKIKDIDGDGKLDISVLCQDSVLILRNISSNNILSFINAGSLATFIEQKYSYGPTDIFIGDINNDSKPDVIIANTESSHSISVYKNLSSPGFFSFSSRKDFGTGSIAPFEIVLENLDGDNNPDFVFSHEYVPRAVSFFQNKSTTDSILVGTQVNLTDNSNGQMAGICTGDLNGDGLPEIISAGGSSFPSNIIYVFKNKANSPYITSFTPQNGINNSVITITGVNFSDATSVSFGGVLASSFTIIDSVTITAVVGTGASGNVEVVTPFGTASKSGFVFNNITDISIPDNNTILKELIVSPNPSHGIITIRYPHFVKKAQVEFYDIIGHSLKKIFLVQNTSQVNVDVSDLKPGLYIIIWSDGRRKINQVITIQ